MKTVKTEMKAYWYRGGEFEISAHTLEELTLEVLHSKLSPEELKQVIHIYKNTKVHDAALHLVELLKGEGVRNVQLGLVRRKDGVVYKAVLKNVPKVKALGSWAKKWKVQHPHTRF